MIRRVFSLLLPCWLTLAGCAPQMATLRIESIIDNETSQPITAKINITVRPDDIKPGEDGLILRAVSPPLNITIEPGKCTYVLFEAEGYSDLEEAFCPPEAVVLPVYVRMGQPGDTPSPPVIDGL